MSYIQAVNIIKGVSEAVNPDGIFVHGRTWDASLEFSNLNIQIYLYPFTGNVDVNNSYYETYQITMGFYFQDTQDSTNEDRQALIQRADNLTRDFLNTLNVVEGVEVSGSRVEPSYRQMSGTYTGYILSFTLGIYTNTCGGEVEPDIPTLETFCEKVDDCLNIPEGDGNYMLKIIDGVKSWVIATASAAWGTITGTITDQTDLVNYITTRLTGYATEAFVTSQGYITNVITSLGYTPENVANKTATISGNESSTTLYPNVKGVVDWANQYFSTRIARNINHYSHTGSTAETKVHSLLLPANTFAVGDIMRLAVRFIKTGTANTWRVRVRVGTADDLTGAQIWTQGGTLAAASRYAAATKVGYFNATNDVEFYASTGVSDEDVITTAHDIITTFDCTVDNYLVFSVELVSGSADTVILSGYYLQKI